MHSLYRYVGLLNLGCTCYMNACVQQFFMMPGFRRELAAITISDEEAEGVQAEDNLLLQLQITFAQLQESERQYFNPRCTVLLYTMHTVLTPILQPKGLLPLVQGRGGQADRRDSAAGL